MTEANDFSKRFIADFIAARLKALRAEKDILRRRNPGDGTAASSRSEEDPASLPTSPTTPNARGSVCPGRERAVNDGHLNLRRFDP
jgi:hypothetical protein